ncbi:MAG TPA: hypothetical protein VIA62_29030 [Thermoanaerobaculia bacterium]|jgi:hypothetical protein|nr:hypothetical protein [Thermoanaerobaculia bacterium]
MNRASCLATLALTLIGGAVSQAAQKPPMQAPSAPSATAILESATPGTVVFDDDGGRAQIIPRQAVAGRDATFHGGPVISHGTVQAVFLGSGWRAKANREKEPVAQAALRGAGLALEDPAGDPVASATISDLEIQLRLDNLLSGAGRIEASTVYVVFLAPGLGSTLGSATSEKDFAAYHNHFHSAAGVVHYVVVPFDADSSRWLANAHQSLHQALINPEGNGWY